MKHALCAPGRGIGLQLRAAYGYEDLDESRAKSALIAERVLASWKGLRPCDVLLVDDDLANCRDGAQFGTAVLQVRRLALLVHAHGGTRRCASRQVI